MSINENELSELVYRKYGFIPRMIGLLFGMDILLLIFSPFFWLFGTAALFVKMFGFSLTFGVLLLFGWWYVKLVMIELVKEELKEKRKKTENN